MQVLDATLGVLNDIHADGAKAGRPLDYVIVSGDLNEYRIGRMLRRKARGDMCGVGPEMVTSSADPANPLLTLINIEGMVASDEIDVTSWAPLDIMTPAVIRTPQEAIEAFWGWIVTQNSQEAIEPAAGE